jgi:hypothetical protein
MLLEGQTVTAGQHGWTLLQLSGPVLQPPSLVGLLNDCLTPRQTGCTVPHSLLLCTLSLIVELCGGGVPGARMCEVPGFLA